MSDRMVVDTSVAFKWFSSADEEGVEEAEELLESHMGGAVTLSAPASLHLELANGLRYSGHDACVVLDLIEHLELAHIELFEMSAGRLYRATELAYRHRLSVYDAVFLALAEELSCPLITADRRGFARIESDVEIRLL